jgi:hypothetical protein
MLTVALIVAVAPEFEAALDRFALHRLPHFRTVFKFYHALVNALDPWRPTKLLEPEVQPVNQGSNFNNRIPHTLTPDRLFNIGLPRTGKMSRNKSVTNSSMMTISSRSQIPATLASNSFSVLEPSESYLLDGPLYTRWLKRELYSSEI